MAPPNPTPVAVKQQKTLLDVAEPFFQYICRLNRVGRHAGGSDSKVPGDTQFVSKSTKSANRTFSMEFGAVRMEIKELLDTLQKEAANDYRLGSQAKKIIEPLEFFADSIISESKLPFSSQWDKNRLAYDRNELAGDEKFFDLLEETLKDSGDEASERLTVFYVCLGLGFTGIYFNQPELLRKKMLEIASRIRGYVDADLTTRLCPEAYEGIDTRNLVQPPTSRLAILGIIFACFSIAVIVSYVYMYKDASAGLKKALGDVLVQNPAEISKK